jgi:double-stranded uracil-DNA glycosylase
MPRASDGSRHRPTSAELRAAVNRRVPDLIAPNLKVLFVGINPGLYSAAVGHHFARPGNRFWPALHAAGFTPRLLSPFNERELLPLGYGVTNVVDRASAAADELSAAEFRAGAKSLEAKVRRFKPDTLAFLGIGAYRAAFDRPKATFGEQKDRIADARVWVLPNPSGLNAHYTPKGLSDLFRQLRLAVEPAAD